MFPREALISLVDEEEQQVNFECSVYSIYILSICNDIKQEGSKCNLLMLSQKYGSFRSSSLIFLCNLYLLAVFFLLSIQHQW